MNVSLKNLMFVLTVFLIFPATIRGDSAPVETPMVARPGSSTAQIERAIAGLEQEIEVALRLGDIERAQHLQALLSYSKDQLQNVQSQSASKLEQDNQLLRISARNAPGEWQQFWQTTAIAVLVVGTTALLVPPIVALWRVTLNN